jgi:hypothetical protein
MAKKLEKGLVEVILHKFYTIKKYDYDQTGEELPFNGDFIPDHDEPKVSYEYNNTKEFKDMGGKDNLILNKAVPIFQEILNKYGNQYDTIEFRTLNADDGYTTYPHIAGIRKETDEEFAKRVKEAEEKEKNKEKLKEQKVIEKQQKKEQKEKELLEGLKKKYENSIK